MLEKSSLSTWLLQYNDVEYGIPLFLSNMNIKRRQSNYYPW